MKKDKKDPPKIRTFYLEHNVMTNLLFFCKCMKLHPNYVLQELIKLEVGEIKEEDLLWWHLYPEAEEKDQKKFKSN